MTFKKDKTQYNSNILSLEPRAQENIACVARVKCARCGVLSPKTPFLGDGSVATVANAFLHPSVLDPLEENGTPGGMSTKLG